MLGLLIVGEAVIGAPLQLRTHQRVALLTDLTGLALWVSGAVVGALPAARRPRNPIGWLLLVVFLLEAAPAGDYAVLDYRVYHGTLRPTSMKTIPVWSLELNIPACRPGIPVPRRRRLIGKYRPGR